MDRSVLVYLTSYAFSFLGNSVAAVVLPLVVLAGSNAVSAGPVVPALSEGA